MKFVRVGSTQNTNKPSRQQLEQQDIVNKGETAYYNTLADELSFKKLFSLSNLKTAGLNFLRPVQSKFTEKQVLEATPTVKEKVTGTAKIVPDVAVGISELLSLPFPNAIKSFRESKIGSFIYKVAEPTSPGQEKAMTIANVLTSVPMASIRTISTASKVSKVGKEFSTASKIITESTNATDIARELSTITRVTDDSIIGPIARGLATSTKIDDTYDAIRTIEVIDRIQKTVGIPVPTQGLQQIAKNVSAITKVTDIKEEKKVLDGIVKDFVDNAPTRKTKIPVEPKALEVPSPKQVFEDARDSMITKIDDALKTPEKLSVETFGKLEELGTRIKKSPKDGEAVAEAKAFFGATEEKVIRKATGESEVTALARENYFNDFTEGVAKLKNNEFAQSLAKNPEKAKQFYLDAKKSALAKKTIGKSEVRKAKQTGKKIGKFQTKQKAKVRLAEVFKRFRNKQETVENFRKAVRQYASDLPIEEQHKIFSRVKFSEMKSGKTLAKIIATVDIARKNVSIKKQQQKLFVEVRGMWRDIKEKGLSNQALVKAIHETGVRSRDGFKTASVEQLEKINGILSSFSNKGTPKVDYTGSFKEFSPAKRTKDTRSFMDTVRNVLGITSTNIRRIAPKLTEARKGGVRGYFYDLAKSTKPAIDTMTSYVKASKKLRKNAEDYNKFSYALFNRDTATAEAIAKQYGFEKELISARGVLTDILNRAKTAKLKVGNLTGYWPRMVADYEGLSAAIAKKYGTKAKDVIEKAIDKRAAELGKSAEQLTDIEKSDIISNVLRGYGDKINVGSFSKGRKLNDLPKEFLPYYLNPEESFIRYVEVANKKIAMKNFLGTAADVSEDTLGAVAKQYSLSQKEIQSLRNSLSSIFLQAGPMNKVLATIKDTTYLTLLGGISNTLTNMLDVVSSTYRNGIFRTLQAFITKRNFSRDKFFQDITHELAEKSFLSKTVERTFKLTGFEKIDKIMSANFMNAAFLKYSALAKGGRGNIVTSRILSRGYKYDRMVTKMEAAFGPKYKQVLKDLANKNITDDVEFFIFSDYLDVSPRVLSEMPQAYSKHPNARIFYVLKSWSLKMLDVVRQDTIQQFKKNPYQAMKNFLKLTAIISVSGATMGEVKEWLFNRKETSFSDKVVSNFLSIFLLSKYDFSTVGKDGLKSFIAGKLLPPLRVGEDIINDIKKLNSDDEFYSDTVRNVPVIGDFWYSQGAGKNKTEKAEKKESRNPANIVDEFAKLPKEEATARFNQMKKDDPYLAARVKSEVKDRELGITKKEKDMRNMNVYDGERAKAILKYIDTKKTAEEKNATYQRLKKAGIISDKVTKQIKELMK